MVDRSDPQTGAKTYALLLKFAADKMRVVGVPDPVRDARILLAKALNTPTDRLALFLQDHPIEDVTARFLDLVDRRMERQPVSQLIGEREFYGRKFNVTPDVLDPRPETELLVEVALEQPFKRVLDLGTGSGCVLLSLLAERPGATGLGVDVSTPSLAVAALNAADLNLTEQAEFVQSDWYDQVDGQFDLVVSNPPYVTAVEYETLSPEVRHWEPKIALTPGGDGLDAYRLIAAGAGQHLCKGGRLIVEIGLDQGQAVAGLFASASLENIRIEKDLDGRDRVAIGQI